MHKSPTQHGLFYLRIRDVPPEEIRDDGTCIYEDGLQVRLTDSKPSTAIRSMQTVSEKWETWLQIPTSREETSVTIEYHWGRKNR